MAGKAKVVQDKIKKNGGNFDLQFYVHDSFVKLNYNKDKIMGLL